MLSDDWKNKYPYTLDEPLRQAMNIASASGDTKLLKELIRIFCSYRQSNYKPHAYDRKVDR